MNNNEYVSSSLELHLFFSRIMKEHSFFLEVAFTDRDKNMKEYAHEFQRRFSELLKRIVNIADGNINKKVLTSNELVTKNTLDAEIKTGALSGENFDTEITKRELVLNSGERYSNEELVSYVSNINKQALPLIKNLIEFKSDILNNVLSCKMYTLNYPLFISHILNEAKMYYTLLNKIENRTLLTQKELYEQELFWNNIMKEHAELIRGLLDPSEEELMMTANNFANEYKTIINSYNSSNNLTTASLNETIKFRDFKVAGEDGILNCKIKSIIVPLLADHVLREANHFIRILENTSM